MTVSETTERASDLNALLARAGFDWQGERVVCGERRLTACLAFDYCDGIGKHETAGGVVAAYCRLLNVHHLLGADLYFWD